MVAWRAWTVRQHRGWTKECREALRAEPPWPLGGALRGGGEAPRSGRSSGVRSLQEILLWLPRVRERCPSTWKGWVGWGVRPPTRGFGGSADPMREGGL